MPSPLSSSSAPIFIVGANRSGTTLLRLMLNAHSRIAVPDELVYFRGPLAGATHEEWAQPAVSPEAYRKAVSAFLNRTRNILAPLSPEIMTEEICGAGPPDWRRPYAHVLSAWAATHGKERWGEKTPGNLFYADVLHDMFPDGQFIYLMRDPRAGVNSMLNAPMFRGDAVINALNRRKYDERGLAHLKRSVPAAQRTLIRFEDLVQTPEATLRDLCTFLGESFEPEMLTYHRDAHRFMKTQAVEEFNGAATRPVSAKKTKAWRKGLSDEQLAEIEWICKDVMIRHGYERTGVPLRWTRRIRGMLVKAYWHLQDWRRRHAPQSILQDRLFQRSRTRLNTLFTHLRQRLSRHQPHNL
jgi:hypothetical protein